MTDRAMAVEAALAYINTTTDSETLKMLNNAVVDRIKVLHKQEANEKRHQLAVGGRARYNDLMTDKALVGRMVVIDEVFRTKVRATEVDTGHTYRIPIAGLDPVGEEEE